jgi:hypothetical protein
MSVLEKLYTATKNQEKRLGIVKNVSNEKQWLKEKRKQRRSDKEKLKVVIKSDLCQ